MFGVIIAGVTAAIGAAVTAIGGALATISATLAPMLGTLLLVSKIVDVVVAMGKKLGFIKEDKEVEELGDKFIQAEEDGIVLDKFDSWEEYKEAVENYEVDPKRSLEIGENEKKVAGLAFLIKDIENSLDYEVGDLLMVIKDMPELQEEGIVRELVEGLKRENLEVNDLKSYFTGTLDIEKSDTIEKIIEAAKKENI